MNCRIGNKTYVVHIYEDDNDVTKQTISGDAVWFDAKFNAWVFDYTYDEFMDMLIDTVNQSNGWLDANIDGEWI